MDLESGTLPSLKEIIQKGSVSAAEQPSIYLPTTITHTIMVIRSSQYPRLPRMYWGELVYATPGTGKTYVANKYRDVVDGDDLIVEAIREVCNYGYKVRHYNDPRHAIFQYFNYIKHNNRLKWQVYHRALEKMRRHARDEDVVLFGTVDLIDEADRIFLQQDDFYIRGNFNVHRERDEADDVNANIHQIYDYLDTSLQQLCRNGCI